MEGEDPRLMRPRRLYLVGAKATKVTVDAGALLNDRARALLRQLAQLGTMRQIRVTEGDLVTGFHRFHSLKDFDWSLKEFPEPAIDVRTEHQAWTELAAQAPTLVVRDRLIDLVGKPLSVLYPRALPGASKVVSLVGRKPRDSKAKPNGNDPPPSAA